MLSHYDVVIFLSTTGDVLNAAQQTAFENFIKGGKGYVGIHAAADGEYDWRWYGNLVGAYFRNHPAGTPTGDGRRGGLDGPVHGRAFRPAGARTDEWYNYKAPSNANGDDYSPAQHARRARPADDGRVDVRGGRRSDGVDDDHPISWCQRYDGGRSFYTGLGHTQASFPEAGILSHIGAGIEIAAGVLPSAACGVAPPSGRGRRGRSAWAAPCRACWRSRSATRRASGTFMPGVDARLHGARSRRP